MEGLAIQCEYFLNFGPSLLVRDVTPEMVSPFIDRVTPIIDKPKADWAWIYELNGLPPPVYKAMYPMGYYIVADYVQKRRTNPIEAINVPWQEFWASFKQN
jgi:hypothetical protein